MIFIVNNDSILMVDITDISKERVVILSVITTTPQPKQHFDIIYHEKTLVIFDELENVIEEWDLTMIGQPYNLKTFRPPQGM